MALYGVEYPFGWFELALSPPNFLPMPKLFSGGTELVGNKSLDAVEEVCSIQNAGVVSAPDLLQPQNTKVTRAQLRRK